MISLERLWKQCDGVCWYCERPTRLVRFVLLIGISSTSSRISRIACPDRASQVEKRKATREHLKRVADGGGGQRANIVLACAGCNSSRGTRSPEEHQLIIRSIHLDAKRMPERISA